MPRGQAIAGQPGIKLRPTVDVNGKVIHRHQRVSPVPGLDPKTAQAAIDALANDPYKPPVAAPRRPKAEPAPESESGLEPEPTNDEIGKAVAALPASSSSPQTKPRALPLPVHWRDDEDGLISVPGTKRRVDAATYEAALTIAESRVVAHLSPLLQARAYTHMTTALPEVEGLERKLFRVQAAESAIDARIDEHGGILGGNVPGQLLSQLRQAEVAVAQAQGALDRFAQSQGLLSHAQWRRTYTVLAIEQAAVEAERSSAPTRTRRAPAKSSTKTKRRNRWFGSRPKPRRRGRR